MSRSEFFDNAGSRHAAKLAAMRVTEAMDAYIDATGDDGSDPQWVAWSKRALEQATEGEQW